jgi:subtilisin
MLAADRRTPMADESTKPPSGTPSATRPAAQGKRQFIIAPRRGSQALNADLRPMTSGAVRAVVGQIPELEIVRVLRRRRPGSALSVIPDEAAETYVVRVDPERAEIIKQTTPRQLIVEEDASLEYGTPSALQSPPPARLASWSSAGTLETRYIPIRVLGEGDRPLANVGVSLAGEGFPQEGRTDRKGDVTLPLITFPGRGARTLLVSAPTNYWEHYLVEPDLSDREVNIIRLRAVGESIFGFPEQFRYGWGQVQMGLDRISENLTGKGVKIAIVDSGVDTTHPLLRQIRLGLDLTNTADSHSWTQDSIGHGSHCAGIIAAREESGKMMRGFAPEAEIHVLKVLPGGRFSNLIEALDYCMDLDIDVVNLSLGSPRPSQSVEQKLEEAAYHGIACIVAAGNSGGPVQYPASSAFALAVAAVGRLNEYPDRTWDATTVIPDLVAPDGTFAPSFSCFGPEVAVCAPGVAIVSTVPGGFEPQSGTSTAVPHVTGLAALLLAHHPLFQGPLRARSAHRVAGLFQLIRSLCVPYRFDPLRTGAGLPRLHGLEQVLQAGAEHARSRPGSGGNGQTVGTPGGGSFATMPGAGAPFGMPVLTLPAAGSMMVGGLVDPRQVAYLPPLLAAPAWPMQALVGGWAQPTW